MCSTAAPAARATASPVTTTTRLFKVALLTIIRLPEGRAHLTYRRNGEVWRGGGEDPLDPVSLLHALRRGRHRRDAGGLNLRLKATIAANATLQQARLVGLVCAYGWPGPAGGPEACRGRYWPKNRSVASAGRIPRVGRVRPASRRATAQNKMNASAKSAPNRRRVGTVSRSQHDALPVVADLGLRSPFWPSLRAMDQSLRRGWAGNGWSFGFMWPK